MTKEEKLIKISQLKNKAEKLKKEADYQSSTEKALKLILNGNYGALSTPYCILYCLAIGSTITAVGREVIQYMEKCTDKYFRELWFLDKEVHKKLCIKDIKKIDNCISVIYMDTDSCFVSFKPIIDHCNWKNLVYSNLDKINKSFIIIYTKDKITTNNPLCEGVFEFDKELQIPVTDYVIVDGHLMKNKDFEEFTKNNQIADKLKWNWSDELYFIQAIDYYRIAGYYTECLEEYAAKYGVQSKHDFELERISDSAIWIAKKKYILNNVFDDGVYHEKLSKIYNKGIEIVRRSTPLFARERIMDVINYLFRHPDDYNIKDLLKIVKNLKKEFQMCVPDKMDEISMQSSCNKYDQYVLQDKDKLNFTTKTPASVKASAYYNYLLHKNKGLQSKYEFFKSGARIKYYYCKDTSVNKIFAFMRGSFPVEFAPEIDVDIQFDKCILSPINTIIKHLNMPEITKRLSVLMDVFGDTIKKPQVVEEDNDLEKELEVDDNGDFVLELDVWDNLY
jgi:DNA polymerase elongation subunit (family B)